MSRPAVGKGLPAVPDERRGMARVLGRWVAEGDWSLADAVRVAGMIGSGNAARVYGR